MQNDPELDGKYLGKITKDFAIVAETLKEASYQIRKQGFSKYPIFPISHGMSEIGQLLIPKEELAIDWNFYATYLDEFINRELIADEEKFTAAYKDPEEFCCLFVIDAGFTNFIFLPFPEE